MSELSQHTNNYTESDIRKYLSGNLSSDQMHAIEKAALDDPFLADAIEGMQQATNSYGAETVRENLANARKQLEERVKEKTTGRVIPIFWKRAAVAAILVIIAGTWLYTSTRNADEQKESLAIDQKKQDAPITINDSTTTSINPSQQTEATGNLEAVEADNKPKSTNEVSESSKDRGSAIGEADNANRDGEEPKNEKSEKSPSKEIAASPKAPVTNAAPESKLVLSKREREEKSKQDDLLDKSADDEIKTAAPGRSQSVASKPAEFINLKVVDSNNLPIANASVTDLEKKKTYLTDQNGNLRLPKSDTVIDASIASVGYQSKQIQLKSDVELNKIQLSSGSNLSEVVVIGYGNQNAKKKETVKLSRRAPKVMVQDAEPVVGWVDYNKYLDSAKSTINATISGDVVISFLVNKSGESSSYKVEQSVSEQLDQAAMTIVKAGSAWRLLKGKKQRVYVIIRF